MPIYQIQHVTKYEYDRPVKESCNEIKIYPFSCAEQEVIKHELHIAGNPYVQEFIDYWGNKTGLFNVLPLHGELIIESRLTIRTTAPDDLEVNFISTWDELKSEVKKSFQLIETSVVDTIENHQAIQDIINSVNPLEKPVAQVVQECSSYIFNNFKYIKGITDVETTVDEILNVKAGVCQDFAHLLLQILRTLKIPSRYVSGYICPNKNGMRGEGATHAWVEAYIPQNGWAGIDPTNNIWVTNNHVKLAVGKHFTDCTPIKGTFKGLGKQHLSVFVSIGYEDGKIFQDVNNINMEFTPTIKKDITPTDLLIQQKQQQQ